MDDATGAAARGGQSLPLPMFPLGTVLFPGMRLPLHVFEPRYRALVADCRAAGREFGVVLIERGHEVGGGDTRFGTGTVARMVAETELPGGRWGLDTVGAGRIRVDTWLPDDPYPVALVRRLPEPPGGPGPALVDAEAHVRRALALAAELDLGPVPPSTFRLSGDPGAALWQLCAVAPLGALDRQALLEADDPAERCRLLARLAGEAADMFASRLTGQ